MRKAKARYGGASPHATRRRHVLVENQGIIEVHRPSRTYANTVRAIRERLGR